MNRLREYAEDVQTSRLRGLAYHAVGALLTTPLLLNPQACHIKPEEPAEICESTFEEVQSVVADVCDL